MAEEGKTAKWTRYQRVKEILNQASGSANPSYQGYGRFWELPLEEFLEATIYGIRMIAPATPTLAPVISHGSCCHSTGASSAPAPRAGSPGRGAASGLIIGLRGECPFDGTQFPRLPWDGQPVSDPDIQFIQDWIDAGCPVNDDQRSPAQVQESVVMARARGDEEHPVSTNSTNTDSEQSGGLKVRKNISSLSWEELQRFRNAIARMKSLDSYYQDERSFGYWARLHANDCQHGWEEFLTWHRLYVYYFEQQLQDIDPAVTLPYWDWTDQYKPDVPATLFDAAQLDPSLKTDNGIVPQAYQCWLDQAAWDRLKANGLPEPLLSELRKVITVPPGEGGDPKDFKTFNSGLRLFTAAGIRYGQDKVSDQKILAELGVVNPLWHALRWPGGDQNLIFEAYPTPDDINRILQLSNFFSFGSGPMNNHFFGALENIHNLIHNFSGGSNPYYKPGTNPLDRQNEPQSGDMVSPGVTAFDPIFWGHHSNVDRLWSVWQTLHPGIDPDDPSAVLPPWTLSVQDTLNIANLGYEYLNASYVYPTDNSVPIARFKSAPAEVAPRVLADHRWAEVRLHKVQYLTRAGFHIRVFLNSPDANVNTPTRGNDNYVGQFNTFSGFCVGGPGHCAPPPETRRKFDLRKRHHKTPGNFHIDATSTVAKLAAQGATAFQVNLVMMNTDGTPATDALLVNAVSLNFVE
ncbi:MAG: tyrosinase family protein [Acidobacteriia bacterium]|nr:tyrosinase family protein [Terriglobia bacterium]